MGCGGWATVQAAAGRSQPDACGRMHAVPEPGEPCAPMLSLHGKISGCWPQLHARGLVPALAQHGALCLVLSPLRDKTSGWVL